MIRPARRWALALVMGTASAAGAQQYVPDPPAMVAGVETRLYHFGPQLAVTSLRQVAVPVTLLVPRGRLTLDVGAWYAHTTIRRRNGPESAVSGFTDAQVRATYVLGSDAVVLTAVANVPTGADRLSPTEYAVMAAASSSFLAFPVNAFSGGLSFTGGVAAALPAGSWNVGLAASARVSDEFSPFLDADGQPFTYRSGPEFRLRTGLDRLIGGGRLSFALTYSTFSTDEYGTTAGARGVYHPGRRLIAEVFYTVPAGASSVTGYVWDFFRSSGDSAGTSALNRENLLAGGVTARVPLSSSLTLEPGLEGRWYRPEEGQAFLVEFSSALRLRLHRRTSLVTVGRLDLGRLEEPAPGIGHAVRGGALSVFVRQLF